MAPGSCLSPRSSPGSFLRTRKVQIPQPSQRHQRENGGASWHPFAGFCPAPSARSSSLPGPQRRGQTPRSPRLSASGPQKDTRPLPQPVYAMTRDHLDLSSHPGTRDRPSPNILAPRNPHPRHPMKTPRYHQHHGGPGRLHSSVTHVARTSMPLPEWLL